MPDEQLPRLALAVMQLERRFVREDDMAERVSGRHPRTRGAVPSAWAARHPDVLTRSAACMPRR